MESISPPVLSKGIQTYTIHMPRERQKGRLTAASDLLLSLKLIATMGLTAAARLAGVLSYSTVAVFGASCTARTGDPAAPTTPSRLLLPELGHSPSFSVGLPTRR